MALYQLQELTFTYPGGSAPALDRITLDIQAGEFVTLCGPSGGGKTTLLRQLKPALAPHGSRSGRILFSGLPLDQLPRREQAAAIGFVLQSPEEQIVTDRVWHELAFGLESLGLPREVIRPGWPKWPPSSAWRTGFTGTPPPCPGGRSSC